MRVTQRSFLVSLHSNASHNLCGKKRQVGIVIPKKGWVHTPNIRGSSMATNKQPQHNPFPGTDAEIACPATGTACLFEAAANPGAAAGSAKPAPWAHQLLMNFRLSRSGRSTELPPVL